MFRRRAVEYGNTPGQVQRMETVCPDRPLLSSLHVGESALRSTQTGGPVPASASTWRGVVPVWGEHLRNCQLGKSQFRVDCKPAIRRVHHRADRSSEMSPPPLHPACPVHSRSQSDSQCPARDDLLNRDAACGHYRLSRHRRSLLPCDAKPRTSSREAAQWCRRLFVGWRFARRRLWGWSKRNPDRHSLQWPQRGAIRPRVRSGVLRIETSLVGFDGLEGKAWQGPTFKGRVLPGST